MNHRHTLSTAGPPRDTAPSRALALAFGGLVAIYCCGYLAWYSTTALGRMPVLDEREILQFALQLAAGTHATEAFYRAPLYPALLAGLLNVGLPPETLAIAARGLNALFHLTTAWLGWRIAARLWSAPAARYVTAGLLGFNPVMLHFAGDALDITFAIMLSMGGWHAVVAAGSARHGRGAWLRAGAWLGLSALARPQFVAVLALLPVMAAVTGDALRARWTNALAALVVPAALFVGIGLYNAQHAGDFRMLPWQGAYNLWAANRPGAHGRFFEQQIPVYAVDAAANTARLESETLYRRETGDTQGDYRAQSDYWRTRTLQAIASDPVRWLVLLARKFIYLCNDVEQYNNKTYAFHKARSPWLRWNPLTWSLLLGAATLGALTRWRRREVRLLVACATVYALGTLLYFVSDRFRVPLVPLAAILAGGIGPALRAPRDHLRAWGGTALVVTFSLLPIPRAEQDATLVQDYLAIGRAHSELGEHAAAAAAADRAVALAPDRQAALALACVARFNAWLHAPDAEIPTALASGWRHACTRAADYSPAASRILGYLDWRDGRRAAARARWQAIVDRYPEERGAALAWLEMTGSAGGSSARGAQSAEVPDPVALELVRAYRGDELARAQLAAQLTPAQLKREYASLARLFGSAPATVPAATD